MKLGTIFSFLLGLVFPATIAAAQSTILAWYNIGFFEGGPADVQIWDSIDIPFSAIGNVTDPLDFGNGLKPLAFDLADNSQIRMAPQSGDVVVLDTGGSVSDLWRFTPAGLLLVYSAIDPGKPVLAADVGIPTSRQSNVLTVSEASLYYNPTGTLPQLAYLPSPGQPGYLPAPPGNTSAPATAYFTDAGDVPEPTTLAGCATAFGLAALFRRRRTLC